MCEYCEQQDNKLFPLLYGGFGSNLPTVFVFDGSIVMERFTPGFLRQGYYRQISKNINYCPMCGRDLRGDNND